LDNAPHSNRFVAPAQSCHFSTGKPLPQFVDRATNYQENQRFLRNPGFTGEMMAQAPAVIIAGICAPRSAVSRRRGGTTRRWQNVPRSFRAGGAFLRENSGAAGIPAQHPLAKRGLLGQ
jgi:hypothetical protein